MELVNLARGKMFAFVGSTVETTNNFPWSSIGKFEFTDSIKPFTGMDCASSKDMISRRVDTGVWSQTINQFAMIGSSFVYKDATDVTGGRNDDCLASGIAIHLPRVREKREVLVLAMIEREFPLAACNH
jgi:hypothetical protein